MHEERDIVLVVTPAVKYSDVNLRILKYLVNERKLYGIYVTVNRPCENLTTLLGKHGVDITKLYFIDAISAIATDHMVNTPQCIYLENPQNLTELSITLTELVKRIPGEHNFLFMDSLSTLILYNGMGSVRKFAHFLATRMRSLNLSGVFISLEEETDKQLIAHFTQVCDKVLEVG